MNGILVAYFRSELDNSCRVLRHDRISCQLAQYRLLVRLCDRVAARSLHAAPRRSEAIYRRRIGTALAGELDPLWGYAVWAEWEFRRGDVWTDIDGAGATVCAGCADEILGSVVYEPGTSGGYGCDESGESVWGRVGAAY